MKKETREKVYNKFGGRCAYSGKELDVYQIDHITPKIFFELTGRSGKDDIDNLIPCEAILNHYKRGLDLEGWRKYLLTLHLRLAKLPNKTRVHSTEKRKRYLLRVAELMDISVDKPFDGVFFFERTNNK